MRFEGVHFEIPPSRLSQEIAFYNFGCICRKILVSEYTCILRSLKRLLLCSYSTFEAAHRLKFIVEGLVKIALHYQHTTTLFQYHTTLYVNNLNRWLCITEEHLHRHTLVHSIITSSKKIEAS